MSGANKLTMSSQLLTVERLALKYQSGNGETEALKNISFSVSEGEYISIVGPSGCGKSTLLSIIAGLLEPTAGRVLLDGLPVDPASGGIGYMLQRDNLLEWRSIYKNVLLGLEIQGKLTEESREYAITLLKNYGLYEFRDKYPAQLSGGMRQRAALIRTLATRPRLLLLDEAFSALDYQTRLSVTDDVYRILRKENKTTLMVTHDIPESISMSDRVLILSRRPAVIQSVCETTFSDDRTPLRCRGDSRFSTYFNFIWKELDVHE